MSTQTNDKYVRELNLIFKTTASDIVANRSGKVSERQKRLMQSATMQLAVAKAGICWIVAGILYFFFYIGWYDFNQRLEAGETTFVAFIALIFAVLPTILVLVGVYFIYKWWKAKDHVEVSQIEGIVNLYMYRMGRRNKFYGMKVDSVKFPLSPSMHHIIKDKLPHRVYFDNSSKHIFAIEPLP